MSRPSWIGYTLGGRYKIEALLGQGGMSAVYRANDPNLRRTVAVKLIHSHLSSDPEFVRRFESEAAAVAQLRHPNIVQVYDFAHDDDVYYMVMEFVPGESLQARLKGLTAINQRMPLPEAADIMATVSDAVAYAHSRGLIHRDLKPANVMLMGGSQPILTDFGVAKILGGQQHTATGAVIGTPAYMSPEQVRGEHLDARADIYSLGIMVYELAAGRPPFEGDSAVTVMLKHINDPVPDIRSLVADVPPAVKAIVDRALAKQPDARYQSAGELATALRTLVQQPVRPAQKPTMLVPEAAADETQLDPSVSAPQRDETQLDASLSSGGTRLDGTMAPPKRATPRRAEEVGSRPATPRPAPSGSGRPVVAPPPKPPVIARPAARGPSLPVVLGLGGGLILCLLVGGGLAVLAYRALAGGGAATTPTERLATAAVTATLAIGQASSTPAGPLPTKTARPQPSDTPAPPTEASTAAPSQVPAPEGMVLAHGGSFQMGSQAGGDASPVHTVTVDPFFIDQFEVTNARYQKCVSDGGCTAPARRSTDTRPGYFTDPNFAQYPMVNLSWDQAQAFCEWDGGKRLPTEAEWEYAATGGDGRPYPWGTSFDRNLVPVGAADTVAVGSFPQNASPIGALDMAGNVVEWVADWYKADFYAASPEHNPLGPQTGSTKVMRGGSFGNADPAIYQTTRRFRHAPGGGDVDIGFRCAESRP